MKNTEELVRELLDCEAIRDLPKDTATACGPTISTESSTCSATTAP